MIDNLTKPLESATRKRIDENLNNLGWKTDEFREGCNVFTERPRTEKERKKIQAKYPNGKFPDYVLYNSETFKPIAVIEAKRLGQNLQQALNQAIKYAECLRIKIVFAVDGAIVETRELGSERRLKLDGQAITSLLSENQLLNFVHTGSDIFTPNDISHTKNELIDIFSFANDLLRKEGMRNGVERFTEFSNLLFLKLIDEIENDREKTGEPRRLEKEYCWSSFYNKGDQELLDYLNDTVLPKLVGKYNHSGDVFEKKLGIKNPAILKNIVNKLSELKLSNTDSDIKGDAFEYFLKNSITVGNDLGEYFTPRHIVKLIVDMVDPKYGDKVYDPCCGTGGFLIEAFHHIRNKVTLTDTSRKYLENETIYGRELTGTAKIAKMNMILAGDGHTNIEQMDSLSTPVKEQYDIVLTNYPFSQKTDYAPRYGLGTSDANPVFLKHIIDALKDGGVAGVVVPDSVLFGKMNDYIKVRKILIENCTVKAIIQLDTSVFRPYTAQPTSIIIFEKRKQTEKVWFFEIVNDGFKKTTSKKGRPPITESDIPLLRGLWNDKEETEKSFFSDIDTIRGYKEDYKLFMNYHKPRPLIKNRKRLADICEDPILGGTPPKNDKSYYGGRHLWVNISDMTAQQPLILDTQTKLSDKGKEKMRGREISKGTLLVSFKLTLGKTAFAGDTLFTNEAICGLTAKDKSDETVLEYLYYILPLMDYTPYAQRAAKGLTLNKELLLTVDVPFPDRKTRNKIIQNLKQMTQEIKNRKEQFKQDIADKENKVNLYMKNVLNEK